MTTLRSLRLILLVETLLILSGAAAFRQAPVMTDHKRSISSRSLRIDNTCKSSTTLKSSLKQYAPQAISLFQNMITPCSILAGAIVPMAFASVLPIKSENESENRPSWIFLRKTFNVVAPVSLLSNLIAVMWSIIAVNQLTETSISPAESVWHLLDRDFSLPWAGVNSHFLFGLTSFAFCVGARSFLQVGGGALGQSVAGFAGGSLLLMLSIVNRAVASGAGDGVHRYGPNFLFLFGRYCSLLALRATAKKDIGVLGVTSLLVIGFSLLSTIRAICQEEK